MSTGSQLFAIGGPTLPAGPIHLVLDAPPPDEPKQSVVSFNDSGLRLQSGCTFDLCAAPRYSPALPDRATCVDTAATLARLLHPGAVPDDVRHVWPAVSEAVTIGNLPGAAEHLQGLGSGLTPTGDDVLAGLLIFTHWVEPASTTAQAIACEAATTDLSRCFLHWASTGQSIQPVHDLFQAASEPGRCRFDSAAARVATIGSSSGRALLAGLGLAATAWLGRKAGPPTTRHPPPTAPRSRAMEGGRRRAENRFRRSR